MESEDDQEVEAVIKTVLVKAPPRCVCVLSELRKVHMWCGIMHVLI